jgi:hypothetical protein
MVNWRFWKKKQDDTVSKTETKTQRMNTERVVKDPSIYYAKGVGDSHIIHVTAWNKEETLDLFSKVREEVKK